MAFLCLSCYTVSAQNFVKAIVYANSSELQYLAEQGVAVDHGKFKIDTYIISDFSQDEIATIKASGIDYEILHTNVQEYYQSRLSNEHQTHDVYKFGDPHLRHHRGAGCGNSGGNTPVDYPQPTNFALGSMGGYFTYQEFVDNLDSMVSKYPNLITAKQAIDSSGNQIGSGTTVDGYPVYWVRISDNPNTDETTESEIMYSAIHHAREPASLSQLIYYMWYLLENYGTNDQVTHLVDNVEMYFVPMINPDGYIYNEQNSPGGGGLWRKNRRNNGGGEYGVDLNRNYSYQFGVSGTSNNPADNTYHGGYPFSEFETRCMRAFHFDHEFRIAMNAHTYGNLLLHPFGYDNVQTADHNLFTVYTDHMVSQNGFSNILSAGLYPAAGDSDDWGYADDLALKPKVLSMTPEIGADSHGFWPATSEIIDICKSTVFMNLSAAHLTWIYGLVSDKNPQVIGDLNGHFKFELIRMGQEPGNLTVSINPIGTEIASIGGSKNYNLPNVLDTEYDSIAYSLDPGIQAGQSFQYELRVSNGSYTIIDTLTKIYGQGTVVYAGNGSMTDWTSSTWNTTTLDFVSAPTSITDSPGNGNDYPNAANNSVTLNQTIDLTNSVSAVLNFHAKWDIEDNYDYCQLMVSSDGGSSWIPMCGLYTETGTNDQDAGEPVYDGVQSTWVEEEIDLNDFLGQQIQIRFRLRSDNFVTGDGYYFDDFKITTIESAPDAIEEFAINLGQNMPNPSTGTTYIPYNLNGANDAKLVLSNSHGQVVKIVDLSNDHKQVQINTSGLAAGVYNYRIQSGNLISGVKRLSVIK